MPVWFLRALLLHLQLARDMVGWKTATCATLVKVNDGSHRRERLDADRRASDPAEVKSSHRTVVVSGSAKLRPEVGVCHSGLHLDSSEGQKVSMS
jgi:hypothetical protein